MRREGEENKKDCEETAQQRAIIPPPSPAEGGGWSETARRVAHSAAPAERTPAAGRTAAPHG